MIQTKKNGENVQITVETGASRNIVSEWEAGNELFAELLAKSINEHIQKKVSQIRENAYNAGWRDKSDKKKRKNNKHSCQWMLSITTAGLNNKDKKNYKKVESVILLYNFEQKLQTMNNSLHSENNYYHRKGITTAACKTVCHDLGLNPCFWPHLSVAFEILKAKYAIG